MTRKSRWPGRAACLGLALLFAAAGADAQNLLDVNGGAKPLEINADNGIEWRRDQKVYVASGNARAARGDLELFADVLTAHYRKGPDGRSEVYKITANGRVRIVSPNEQAVGERGAYDVDNGIVVLLGENLKYQTENAVITARDSLEYWEARNMAVARGDAVATREDRRIEADVLAAHFAPDETDDLTLDRIEAYGNVSVADPKNFASGERGTYFVKREVATLRGDVKITRGENQLNGDFAEVNLATGVSRLTGVENRVKGLLLPKDVPQSEADPLD